jgi:protein-S-isoprenylcysteine O-methyltransferase Ste14
MPKKSWNIFARWAVLEEHTLRKELSGYEDYLKEVKFRIIPFFW